MEQREFTVEAEAAGQRIDRFLAGEDTGLSRSALQNLITEGRVLANGRPAAKNLKLKTGHVLLVSIPELRPSPPSRRISRWTSSMRTPTC